MDEVDQALKQLFLALMKANPKTEAFAWREAAGGPWDALPRRKRIVSIMTVLLRLLDESI